MGRCGFLCGQGDAGVHIHALGQDRLIQSRRVQDATGHSGSVRNCPTTASRQQSSSRRAIIAPAAGSDFAQAGEIMRQLGMRGEIEWTVTRSDASRFDFRVNRPGHIFEVQTDLDGNRATEKRIDLNVWGVMRILHSFTGVRMDDNRNGRDWFLTSVWVLAIDAVAAALILMVLSSLIRASDKTAW
ncbi:MAG TPA: hypothetical protein P5186_20330 [Candidatus Paceibacterota bacterium]|nr:hypothetical protein [Candidatus Paceibacterota bacterium]